MARIENRLKHKTAATAWLDKASRQLFKVDHEVKKARILFYYEQASGEIAGEEGQFGAALGHYQEAIGYFQLCSGDPIQPDLFESGIPQANLRDIYFELGQQLRRLGRLEEALSYKDEAYRLC